MVGLGGLEPPTSPLSVVIEPLVNSDDGLRRTAIRSCLCGLTAAGRVLPLATLDGEC